MSRVSAHDRAATRLDPASRDLIRDMLSSDAERRLACVEEISRGTVSGSWLAEQTRLQTTLSLLENGWSRSVYSRTRYFAVCPLTDPLVFVRRTLCNLAAAESYATRVSVGQINVAEDCLGQKQKDLA
ncbi:hypothetical protein BDBG_03252 [Blastomyces gilchristii SLH14081]|uniref:Uncharacterized protein n=1 Tax=Blastomyces gilchristii (strain SLH14081) TaxID=559298 RepID=A0A179UGI4_BLAGS|nr:uncharacterized protein BDBG_03252 [Blastomyces gilchristii SLH14081]OAT07155.1 hypothetical protein BDBG_03252 [Blastomyces gilchristii SLH14081]